MITTRPPHACITVSALARHTIKAAFEDLGRTITPADSRDFPVATLQHVRNAALDIETQLAARQSLRNMRRLMPLFQGLEHYAKVVDVLCNGTPYLAWIWAPITLILRVASEYLEAFEQIIKGYSQITDSLVRFEILGNAFIDNSEFQQTLAVFYADILQFHKHAYKFVRRSSWRLMFHTSWGRFQRRFDSIRDDMNRHGALLDQEANARNIAESRQQRQEIEVWREKNLDDLKRTEDEQTAKHYRFISSWLRVDESEQLAIFESAASEGAKYPGTCGWALENSKIASWLRIPGSGKSVLTAQLINFMKIARGLVIRHFLNFSYAATTTYENVLKSLLLQLLREDGDLAAYVYHEHVLGKKSPSVSVVEQLVKSLFAAASHEPRQTQYIWVFIDGLDACDSSRQANLVGLMSQITSRISSSGGTICKVLFSSRTCPILSKSLRRSQTVSLTEEKRFLNLAIKEYASQRLKSLHRRFHQLHLGPSEVNDIQIAIARKANGMFLYARLVLDYLDKKIFYTGDEVKNSINDLPEELSKFYLRILTQILVRLDSQSADRVKSVFGWISFSRRPLKRLELLSALTFSSGNPAVVHLVPDFILDVCGALIEERLDATLTFIHITVKEFLQSSSSSLPLSEANVLPEHGIAAVTCLLSGLHTFSESIPNRTKNLSVVTGLHGFHLYASEHWIEYLLLDVASNEYPSMVPTLYLIAGKLVDRLMEIDDYADDEGSTQDSNIVDSRPRLLRDHPRLYKHVETALRSRTIKAFKSQIILPGDSKGASKYGRESKPQNALPATLASYQRTVRFLLQQDDYPGVSSEELADFKKQFYTSAFTCRLRLCPYATLGFELESLRDDHEAVHARRFPCTNPDCRYPPFISADALRKHVDNKHTPKPTRKPIFQRNTTNEPERQTAQVIFRVISSVAAYVRQGNSPWSDHTGAIKCKCNASYDDGDMIQCEQCGTWQHYECSYLHDTDSVYSVGCGYVCSECQLRFDDPHSLFGEYRP
ncbi:hypothetical protein BJ170DRAFT_700831 [Xylariales sp. AK1849]|nr:hypothetical protein BJ170DRAFT_700831 [Xylariales sp. AK1849]